MRYSDIELHYNIEQFRKELNESLTQIDQLDEGLFSFSDIEQAFVQKVRFAYQYKNIGVFIGRKLTDKRQLTKMEALRLDKYIRSLLKERFKHPIIKLLVKLLVPFLAITVLSVLVVALAEASVISATTAIGYLTAKNILGFAAFAVTSGAYGYASADLAEKLAEHLSKVKEDIGSTLTEYINNNIGKSKFAMILSKIQKIFTVKNEVEEDDVERSMAEV